MKCQIKGDDFQIAEVELDVDEFVQSEAGSMLYIDGDIEMDVRVPGGWVGGLKRIFVGESLVLPVFKSKKNSSKVVFAPSFPAKIIELNISENLSWQAQKSSFLFAHGNVAINISFVKKFRVGVFGGEGFILEKFTGNGKVFINCGGLAIERILAPDETVLIDSGCVVAFEESVTYDVKRLQSFKTALFGGEGLFMSTLTGPGKIIIQSLPFSRFRNSIFTGANSNSGPLSEFGRIFGGD